MPPLDQDHALVALGMAVAGTQFFSAANPSIFTIRRLGVDGEVKVSDIRHGELFSATATIALGLVVSAILDHPAPTIMAVIIVAVMVGMYEWALATRASGVGEAEGEA